MTEEYQETVPVDTGEQQPTEEETSLGDAFAEEMRRLTGESDEEEGNAEEEPEQEDEGEDEGEPEEEEQEIEEPEQEEDDAPAHAPKKGTRAYREFMRAQKAEKALQAMREDNIRRDIEMKNLQDSIDYLTKQGTKKEQEAPDYDKILSEAGFDPDSIVDKEAVAKLILRDKERDEAVTKTSKTATETQYYREVDNTLGRLDEQSREVVQQAIGYLIETEAQTILAQARYSKQNITREQALDMAAGSVDELAMQQYTAGVNPVEWSYEIARARGFRPQQKQAANENKVNIKGLKQARDRAGAPQIDRAPVKSGGSSWEAELEKAEREFEKKRASQGVI